MDKMDNAGTIPQPLFAKLPLLDRDGQCFANSLSMAFLAPDKTQVRLSPPEQTTKAIIANTFGGLSVEQFSEHKPLFIPFFHEDLVDGIAELLPKNKVVVELAQKDLQHQAVVDAVKSLKAKGYAVALNNFCMTARQPNSDMAVNFIRIDVDALNASEIEGQLFLLKRNPAKLIASGIHSEEKYHYCQKLTFDYFQGNYFFEPDVFHGEPVGVYHSNLVKIISEVTRSTLEVDDLVHLLSQDPTLSYRLLMVVNSAYYRGMTTIKSLRQAIVRMGLQAIKGWVLLLSIKKLNHKPSQLIELTIQRARMCELLAQRYLPEKTAECFTLGLLSTLDALLDRSMEALLEDLPVGAVFKKAIIQHEGRMGRMLADSIDYQQGHFQRIVNNYIPLEAFAEVYKQAICFAKEMMEL